jgi:integrase
MRGKRGKDRVVRIDHEAARRVDRYLRVRARHPQVYRSGLWLGIGDRGPLTRNLGHPSCSRDPDHPDEVRAQGPQHADLAGVS